jgi:hypothetical protein
MRENNIKIYLYKRDGLNRTESYLYVHLFIKCLKILENKCDIFSYIYYKRN